MKYLITEEEMTALKESLRPAIKNLEQRLSRKTECLDRLWAAVEADPNVGEIRKRYEGPKAGFDPDHDK